MGRGNGPAALCEVARDGQYSCHGGGGYPIGLHTCAAANLHSMNPHCQGPHGKHPSWYVWAVRALPLHVDMRRAHTTIYRTTNYLFIVLKISSQGGCRLTTGETTGTHSRSSANATLCRPTLAWLYATLCRPSLAWLYATLCRPSLAWLYATLCRPALHGYATLCRLTLA